MAGHLSSRIFTAATGGLVRKTAPLVTLAATTTAQLIALAILATPILILPTPPAVAVALIFIPALFGLLVAAEQVRITYATQNEAVYPDVEVFPDREPT